MFVLVSAMTTIAFVLLLQAASGQMAPPVIVRPADDRTVSAPLRGLGDTMEIAGRCSRFIAPADMGTFLAVAKANPADEPYLISRIGKGSQHPKDPAWCNAAIKTLGRK